MTTTSPQRALLEGNEATASVAYRLSETIAIYPITPSSGMAEYSDEWAAKGMPNVWGTVPEVVEMQSEGGAAGAVHGALQAGALTTTFTASQGLLLMIPNMYKIAGELTSFCMHVSARTLATHALSIFGDHQDVMSCRSTGFAMIASNNVQEAHDIACISHLATLEARVPFLHFFEGFRTSHEINVLEKLTDEHLRELVPLALVKAHRERALSPDRPTIRGTAQNPDVFFQAREACNPFYNATPAIVERAMARFAAIAGREYALFEYLGHPEAEHVAIAMGSGCETLASVVEHLNAHGSKTGLVKVRLFRPFSARHLAAALPQSVKSIAVLDRTKEPGALAEPLHQDIICALDEARDEGHLPETFRPRVIGGRYGLSSKEFSPAMAKAVFTALEAEKPRRQFTVGIVDDVTHLSLPIEADFDIEDAGVFRGVFFGLGSDGTVGANKNSVKIIGEGTHNYAQAYFVYDSKKSGAITTSHLRFGPKPIRAPYLIKNAQFVGCHQFSLLEKYDVLDYAAPGAVFLLNSIYDKETVWKHLPREVQQQIIEKQLKFYVIDAYRVARETGMGARINTIMQTCFFAISGVLPAEEAIAQIKHTIEKTYGRKGRNIVEKNFAAVDGSVANLHQVNYPDTPTSDFERPPVVPTQAPDFVQRVTRVMMENKGDLLPVSAFPPDGTWPTATTQWEKRNVALEIPQWDASICIQCNKCVLVCPHAAIRAKFYPEEALAGAPDQFQSVEFRSRELANHFFTIQVAPEDCTGCHLCVEVCPAKDKKNPSHKAIDMVPQEPIREREVNNYDFFLKIPDPDPLTLDNNVKGSQFRQPLFEYSGACAGCGETPYVKLMTQLFGDRMLIANATGCSSIYGGNLPTTPYCTDDAGRGPTWSNSLFEDNAEFGFGYRLGIDKQTDIARALLLGLAPDLGEESVNEILTADQTNEKGIFEQRTRIDSLRAKLEGIDNPLAAQLHEMADFLVKKSVWILGGDGWAYDIGYGGLDHVLASGRDVNILVLDTGVYSNTGGQQSKATPMGAIAKFAAAGKALPKKDLGLQAIMYGHVYVAQIAMGSKDNQTVQAFLEAESYPGPSLIIAYSHCIAHGYNMAHGMEQQKLAVDSGFWPLYRFDPRRAMAGEVGLKLDSREPKVPLSRYMENEARFRMLQISNPERAKELAAISQAQVEQHFARFQLLAQPPAGTNGNSSTPSAS